MLVKDLDTKNACKYLAVSQICQISLELQVQSVGKVIELATNKCTTILHCQAVFRHVKTSSKDGHARTMDIKSPILMKKKKRETQKIESKKKEMN